MRTFTLQREEDVSGVSGTGTVAEGAVFADGKVAMRWIVGMHKSTAIFDSIEDVVHIHGHEGATLVHWEDMWVN